ncbi:MAG: acyltransferase family protein [Actinobacteria bacterium]|nr:acyltransferase family protein [Actinomycetota bacterium]
MSTSTIATPARTAGREARSAAQVAAATPARRERFVDFLRVFSLAVVVLGHWLMAAVEWRDGRLSAGNVLESTPDAQWLTWLFQIMPVFFVVGGFANAASWTATQRDRNSATPLRGPLGPYGHWLSTRLARLVRPVLAFALVWSVAVLILAAAGIQPSGVRAGSIAQPLWFLAVYVVVVAIAPVAVAAQHRWGWTVPVALAVGVAAVDLARWPLRIPLVGWVNLALVWLFAHQLGVA